MKRMKGDWAILLGVFALFGGGYFWIAGEFRRYKTDLRCDLEGDAVRCTASHDGPFVITTLVIRDEQLGKIKADLSPSIALVDSGGVRIPVTSQVWRDVRGEPVPTPTKIAKTTALYFVPLESRSRHPESAESH